MTSVIGYADMLYQRNLPREEVKSAAGYILKEGMRLESLSLKLMDLFVLDKQEFILEKMSVREMFENLEQGIEPVCRKHGAILHMEIEDGIIRVDYDLFKTMVLNLADNALKADCRDVWVEGKQDGNIYQIRIKDNGKGIPPEELERITEAFYMVDKSRSRKQHGAGIGMALVSKIVEVYGAKMEIESDGKTGTQIYLNFVAGGEEMISKYKYTIVLLIFAAFFIFGSMEVMDYILRIRETQLLTESGRVEMESPVRTWESWENDKEGMVSEDIASEGKCSENRANRRCYKVLE